jgi:S1-C subfamily serine protease
VVFFLNADEQVYARYGGRDGRNPDARQSLDGLRYTMQSVLAMHERKSPEFAPREPGPPQTIRQVAGRRGRGCMHCHQVKEVLNDELQRTGQWEHDRAWRYPLPDNLGLFLEVDRGNVVERVATDSPAARAGLQPKDVVRRLNGVPIHSQGDVQFALDRVPRKGKVALTWERDGTARSGELTLAEGWRRSDITWRPSMQHLIPSLPVFGEDLTPAEKKALGLSTEQLAFRQRDKVHTQAQAAGIRARDIILGVDDRKLENMDAGDLYQYVRHGYLAGDRITINVLRDGKRLRLPLTLR